MGNNLVDLDDLLKRLKSKETAPTSSPATTEEAAHRPFQALCNDAIRAYGNANVHDGETSLDALREEVGAAGVSPNQPSLPLSNAYAKNRHERLARLENMYRACLLAVGNAKKRYGPLGLGAKALLEAREAAVDAKKRAWEKKVGAVSRTQYGNVSDQLRRVEADWAGLVEGNELGSPPGRGMDDPVMRLETAKALGTDASESTFARAEEYGRAKQRHKNVEWRLSETVRHVTDEYLARTHENVEKAFGPRPRPQSTVHGRRFGRPLQTTTWTTLRSATRALDWSSKPKAITGWTRKRTPSRSTSRTSTGVR